MRKKGRRRNHGCMSGKGRTGEHRRMRENGCMGERKMTHPKDTARTAPFLLDWLPELLPSFSSDGLQSSVYGHGDLGTKWDIVNAVRQRNRNVR